MAAAANNSKGYPIHWNWTTDVWDSGWIGADDFALSNFIKVNSELFSGMWEACTEGEFLDGLVKGPGVTVILNCFFLGSLIERIFIAVATIFTAAAEAVRNLAYVGLNACGCEPSAASQWQVNPDLIG